MDPPAYSVVAGHDRCDKLIFDDADKKQLWLDLDLSLDNCSGFMPRPIVWEYLFP
jgi:hypothetical protein